MNANDPIHDQPQARWMMSSIDPPPFLLGRKEDVLGLICGVIQDQKWEFWDAPLIGELSAHDWRDVKEVDGT